MPGDLGDDRVGIAAFPSPPRIPMMVFKISTDLDSVFPAELMPWPGGAFLGNI